MEQQTTQTGRLVFENAFTCPEHFFDHLLGEVLKQQEIYDQVLELDFESDMGRRIFFELENGEKYTIRTWNIHDTDNEVYVDYTLFRDED
jgi:hypothetical protein